MKDTKEMQGPCQQRVTKGTIGMRLNMLTANLDILKDEVAGLENELGPILRGHRPQTDSLPNEHQPESQVASAISAACDKVDEIMAMVRSMRERIDL